MKNKIIISTLLALLISTICFAEDKKPIPRSVKVGWTIVLSSVAVYEVWAVKTKHETLSQGVQHSKAMKVIVGVGLSGVAVHFYLK